MSSKKPASPSTNESTKPFSSRPSPIPKPSSASVPKPPSPSTRSLSGSRSTSKTPSSSKSSTPKSSTKPLSDSKSKQPSMRLSMHPSTKSFLKPTVKAPMNASMMVTNSKFKVGSNLNSTIQPRAPIIVAPNDDDMECRLAYCEYLQNLMKKQLIEKEISNKRAICNMQLDAQKEMLHKSSHKVDILKRTIEEIELHIKLINELNDLNNKVTESNKIIDDSIVEHITEFNNTLEIASRKLILNNVDELKSPEEYKRFEELLYSCSLLLEKIQSNIGDVEGTKQLATCLETIRNLYQSCDNKYKKVEALKQNAILLTLENVSAKLALVKFD